MNADHRSICKFETLTDPNYVVIRNALASMVQTTSNLGRANHKVHGECAQYSNKAEIERENTEHADQGPGTIPTDTWKISS
jgi:hypothetical protein